MSVAEKRLGREERTYWCGGKESDERITLSDILDFFEDNGIGPIEMKTKDIFCKLSGGKEVLRIIAEGGAESEEWVKYVSLDEPIIVLVREGNIDYVLDGNHRLQKAKDIGEEKIFVCVLDLDDCRTPDIYGATF